MYGKGIKCDMCGRVEVIDGWSDSKFFDAGFRGWIRISLNAPRDYGWSFREPMHSSMVKTADCCSIDCTTQLLREASGTLTPSNAEEAAK